MLTEFARLKVGLGMKKKLDSPVCHAVALCEGQVSPGNDRKGPDSHAYNMTVYEVFSY